MSRINLFNIIRMFYYTCLGHIGLDVQYIIFFHAKLRGQVKVIFHNVVKLPIQDAVLLFICYTIILLDL